MNKNQVIETLKELRSNSKKRKFDQSIDLIINLKELDMKKSNVDTFVTLPHLRGKDVKICAIVGPELENQAREYCNKVILKKELDSYKTDPKKVKSIAKECDIFIAQDGLMGQIAAIFGRILGPLGKMPNPKIGGVITPTGQVKPAVEKHKKIIKVMTKKEPVIKINVGKESLGDDVVADNIMMVYDNIVHQLPKEQGNIKNVIIKMTMSKPLKVGEKHVAEKKEKTAK